MAFVKGPFIVKWGDNILQDVEEIQINHEVNSEEYETVGGKTVEIDGAYKVSAEITLLASDIPALSAILPQYFAANGTVLSTGETVNNANGAIDITAASCNESITYNNLDIIACGNPAQVLRINNARTRIEGIEIDGTVQKVSVKFIGEGATGEATIQMFKQGTLTTIS